MGSFTAAISENRIRREVWLEQLAELCGRRANLRFSEEPFAGSIQHHQVGGISICRFSHNVLEMEQNRLPRSEDCRYIMLAMQLGGKSQIRQGSGEITVAAGELALIDSFRPFSTRFEGANSQLIAYLPAAELATTCSSNALSQLRHMAGREGIGPLLRSTLLNVAKSADQLDYEDAAHAREMLIGLVRRVVDRNRKIHNSDEQLRPDRRILEFIDARLADPDLAPSKIAAGCGVSLRRLHRSFAGTQWSVCGWIRHRRLERCRQDLLAGNDRSSITQIAFRWGFNDAAHFSRSFREAYSQSPREMRQHAA